MPSSTLFFLVTIIAVLLYLARGEPPDRTATGKPADFSRVPYFLRYNAPVRKLPDTRDVVPIVGLAPATDTPAQPAASGFAGFSRRIV